MTRPPKRKSGQDRKSKAKGVRLRASENDEAKHIGKHSSALPILPNTHDHLVIQKLRTMPVGELAVDRLVRDAPQTALTFRDVLRNVYFKAAKTR